MADPRPYRPTSGSEGDAFMEDFCDRCTRHVRYRETQGAQGACEIMISSMAYEVTDPKYPKEWLTDGERDWCTAFEGERAD